MPRAREPGQLDKLDRAILRFLIDYFNEYGRSPTVREIVEHVDGISSTSVAKYHLQHLKDAGRIFYEGGIARGIEVRDMPQVRAVPKVGYIAAGHPIETLSRPEDEVEEWVSVPRAWLPRRRQKVFALEVRGNSMIDASVHDGDIVILEPVHPDEVRDGDMVAVWLQNEQETTLKCFYRKGRQVRLQPANAAFQPIDVDAANITIQGRVVAVIRQVRGCTTTTRGATSTTAASAAHG